MALTLAGIRLQQGRAQSSDDRKPRDCYLSTLAYVEDAYDKVTDQSFTSSVYHASVYELSDEIVAVISIHRAAVLTCLDRNSDGQQVLLTACERCMDFGRDNKWMETIQAVMVGTFEMSNPVERGGKSAAEISISARLDTRVV